MRAGRPRSQPRVRAPRDKCGPAAAGPAPGFVLLEINAGGPPAVPAPGFVLLEIDAGPAAAVPAPGFVLLEINAGGPPAVPATYHFVGRETKTRQSQAVDLW